MSHHDSDAGVIDALVSDRQQAPAANSSGGGTVVQVGTHFFRQRYLFAFATQAEVLQYLRTQSSDTDATRQAEIMDAWVTLQKRVAELLKSEAGLADTIRLTAIPDEHQATLEGFAGDPLFQKSFATL